MGDTKESMPSVRLPEKPTVKFEAPPEWAVAMAEKMENGFRGLRADVSMVSNDVGLLRDRVVILERHKVDSEERGARASSGVRQLSETDAKHDAAIAMVITKVDRIETALTKNSADTSAIKKAIDDFVRKNPKAISSLIWGVIGVIGAALAAAAAWFQGRGGR
jgi:hypothetical protein